MTLYEINTRVWRQRFGQDTTLLSVPDAYWQQLRALGVDYVWLMGVWQNDPQPGQSILRYALVPDLQGAYSKALPDWTQEDIIGSPYAIDTYRLHPSLGGADDLRQLKTKLNHYGLRLILDFVPNHFHAETRWLAQQPEVFLSTAADAVQRDGVTFYHSDAVQGRAFAHGKDPYFAAWQDTVQVNYAHPAAQAFMQQQLLQIAEQCDGVRCDMAMLMLPDVFAHTWQHVLPTGSEVIDFWTRAIHKVKQHFPAFTFLAEVYWDLEWELQQRGFDYTYDKRLRDRLLEGHVSEIRDHLHATPQFQARSARFLDNHDESRIRAEMPARQAMAAAMITYTVPGLRFFYEGQWEGRRRRLPVQLGRQPVEHYWGQAGVQQLELPLNQLPGFVAVSTEEPVFYDYLLRLLQQPALRHGHWQMLETDAPCLAWTWTQEKQQLAIWINYSAKAQTITLPSGQWVYWEGPKVAGQVRMEGYEWIVLTTGG